jgi:hypothetical protein
MKLHVLRGVQDRSKYAKCRVRGNCVQNKAIPIKDISDVQVRASGVAHRLDVCVERQMILVTGLG